MTADELSTLFGSDAQERVNPHLSRLYSSAAATLWGVVNGLLEVETRSNPPKLTTVNSLSARPQTITAADGTPHVVYDQNFGSVANQLTRLALNDAHPLVVDAYLAKLLAHRNYVVGRNRPAVALALMSRAASKRAAELGVMFEESSELELVRKALVAGQEHFIIAHELTHIALTGPVTAAARERLAAPAERAFELLEALLEKGVVDGVLDDRRDDVEAYVRRLGTGAREEIEGIVAGRTDRAFLAHVLPAIRVVRQDHRARDEIVCDLVGAMAAAIRLKSVMPAPFVYAGAALGLMNLRLVQFLDSHTRERPREPAQRVDRLIVEAEQRYLALRGGISTYILEADESSPAFDAKDLPETLALVQDVHDAHRTVLQEQLAMFLVDADGIVAKSHDNEAMPFADEDRRWLSWWLRMPVGMSLEPGSEPLLYSKDARNQMEARTEELRGRTLFD